MHPSIDLRHGFNVLPCILQAEPSETSQPDGTSGETPEAHRKLPRIEVGN
jgi:hypothetical protein